eukprot:CAMPEP_0179424514 /NCGR_PEP_ID=MMETSP0799-20121207/11636_1 /TAXON_ID=46947 /ORGANISM="Geminigera cryophila, Strain CCMP2564" /LENGTH=222 /DNA_ID=CAMNT_0021198985 /DNA_START=1 /DNA_END=669 /DNA_ORIENTATION=-
MDGPDQHATQSTPAWDLIRQHKGLFDEKENTATLNNILDFWTKKASETLVNIAEATGLDIEVLRQKKSFEVEPRLTTGLEYSNTLISNGGLVMVQDLPDTERRNEHFEKQRWGRDHDLVVVLCKNAHLDADIGWELYQLSVLFKIKDISEDPGWMEALQRNRDAGGTLALPIFLQGDRIYWGQTGNDLHEMIRMFRQNQSERLDQLPDLVQQHYGGDATLAI